jgi:hypothetical protein
MRFGVSGDEIHHQSAKMLLCEIWKKSTALVGTVQRDSVMHKMDTGKSSVDTDTADRDSSASCGYPSFVLTRNFKFC